MLPSPHASDEYSNIVNLGCTFEGKQKLPSSRQTQRFLELVDARNRGGAHLMFSSVKPHSVNYCLVPLRGLITFQPGSYFSYSLFLFCNASSPILPPARYNPSTFYRLPSTPLHLGQSVCIKKHRHKPIGSLMGLQHRVVWAPQ